VSGTTTFTSPSGTDIHVRVGAVASGENGEGLVEQMASTVRTQLAAVDATAGTSLTLADGRVVHERRFACSPNGVRLDAKAAGMVDDGRAVVAFAMWPPDDVETEAAFDLLIAGVVPPGVASRPQAAERAAGRVAPAARPDRSVDWSNCRARWATAGVDDGVALGATRWSVAELAFCSWVLDAPSFPTADWGQLGAMSQDAFDATVETLAKSFLARGLLRADDDGRAQLTDDVSRAFEVAVFPDLTIFVERLVGAEYRYWWLGLRADAGVMVVPLPDGSREVSEIESGAAVTRLLHLTDVDPSTATLPTVSPRVTLNDVVGGGAPARGLTRVTTGWKADNTVAGGVVTWADGPDHALWLAELDPVEAMPTWQLTPATPDTVRAELLAHLP
jgi:hypothetical protein